VGEDFCPHPRLVEREAGFTPAVPMQATFRAKRGRGEEGVPWGRTSVLTRAVTRA
jgi:hypothetical protein